MNTDTRFNNDGWDVRARLGVVVPHADVGPESELNAMAPAGLSVHASRLHFSAMRAGGEMDPTIPHDPVRAFVEPPGVDECVEALAAAPLDVLACAFTSSAYKHGVEGEREFLARLDKSSRGIPVISTALAAVDALRACGVERLALVNPPWFDTELDELGARYFSEQGFRVVHHAPCGIPSGQRHATPPVMFDWVRGLPREVDGVFIAGNGLRAVGTIAPLEEELGVPVLSANQVLLWRALTTVGLDPAEVRGYGRLFARE
ncbi:maleate cis-trans isomerase family protein [Actinopolyspora mortivallis]|uniref:maleate cis-trans isomerase family protein n=1 Tax=Actinopolyspora mortivallis TaxID=33906 RepID=UPI00036B1A43|nr:hypothetical protein [Actinopolyspora mortivallis]